MKMVKVTSDTVNLQEVSMLCMDWVSGTPREERVTKYLFSTPDKHTAFIPLDTWDSTFSRLSEASPEALSKVSPTYADLARTVDEGTTIPLKTLCAALISASDGSVFVTIQEDTTEVEGGVL